MLLGFRPSDYTAVPQKARTDASLAAAVLCVFALLSAPAAIMIGMQTARVRRVLRCSGNVKWDVTEASM